MVGQFGPERVARQIENYDRECQRKQENPPTPGWLVCAIQQDFAVREMTCSLMTHDEMLRWCQANGGLHRTTEFESEKQAYGTTLFRRRRLPGE